MPHRRLRRARAGGAAVAPWLPGARGLVVAGSAGPALWRRFRALDARAGALWDAPDPYDAFVAALLGRADAALRGPASRSAASSCLPRAAGVDFLALAELVGLGRPGPFALAIHAQHGAWWALRGAWLVDADVDPAARCIDALASAARRRAWAGGKTPGTIGLRPPEVRRGASSDRRPATTTTRSRTTTTARPQSPGCVERDPCFGGRSRSRALRGRRRDSKQCELALRPAEGAGRRVIQGARRFEPKLCAVCSNSAAMASA